MGRVLIAGALVFLASCRVAAVQPPGGAGGSSADSVDVVAADTLTLAAGESVEWGGAEIGFGRIQKDSRCPIDVQCLWEGNAAAETWIGPGGGMRGPAYQFILNTALEPRSSEAWGVRITLLRVHPEPVSTQPIPPGAYAVTLAVAEIGKP